MRICKRCNEDKSLEDFQPIRRDSVLRRRICRECYYVNKREKYQADRLAAFEAYGGVRCVCCGITEPVFLSFDHINGGGAKHFTEVGAGYHFVKWLRINGYPPGFRVLCHNCNMAEAHGGCPHQTERH